MLIQHIRRTKTEVSPRKKAQMKRRVKIGILIAEGKKNGFKIGWSLCMKGDKFSKGEGLAQAQKRLEKNFDLSEVPNSIKRDVENFVERCKRYFK